jgi:hypothetical protein
MPHFATRQVTLSQSLVWLTAAASVFAGARPGWPQVVASHAIAFAADAAQFYVILESRHAPLSGNIVHG